MTFHTITHSRSPKHSQFYHYLKLKMIGTLNLNITPYTSLCSKCSTSQNFNLNTTFNIRRTTNTKMRYINTRRIRAIGTTSENGKPNEAANVDGEEEDGPPYIGFAFISPVLLPDGTPDVHMRSATGGQKLRDIMLDNHMDLYGPYGRALLNCGGGGVCGTCLVEIVEGKELLSRKTDIEKDLLKRKPKHWRLACQTTVGTPDSWGVVGVQTLPEWKAHEWRFERVVSEDANVSE